MFCSSVFWYRFLTYAVQAAVFGGSTTAVLQLQKTAA